MDIVAKSLSADTLRTQNVTVRGQDVLEWFESKLSSGLSSGVSFLDVFDDLSAAPKMNGAIAIVGSKDYIYSERAGEWQEFGDEGQIGALTQAVQALTDSLSGYQPSGDYISTETDPVFRSLSSTFLTAHQSLSGIMSFEAASGQMQTLARDLGISYTSWTDPFRPNDNAGGDSAPLWFYPRAFGMPEGAYIRAITMHTTATSPTQLPNGIVHAKIYREGSESSPLTRSGPVLVNRTDSFYTFVFETDAPLSPDVRYAVQFYDGYDSSSPAKMAYRLYLKKSGSDIDPGSDIVYGRHTNPVWRPELAVKWSDGTGLDAVLETALSAHEEKMKRYFSDLLSAVLSA